MSTLHKSRIDCLFSVRTTRISFFAKTGFLPAPKHKNDKEAFEGDVDAASHRAAQMASASQYVANMV